MKEETLAKKILSIAKETEESAKRIAEDLLRSNLKLDFRKIRDIIDSKDDSKHSIVERLKLLSDLPRYGASKEKMVLKYGDLIGNQKWESYRAVQAETNTFEYKSKKFGMTKDEFDRFNKTRAVTLENLVNRHGETTGRAKWDEYCERQAYTNTVDYFIELYGDDLGVMKWKAINKKKSLTLANFQTKYGEIEGRVKYEEFVFSVLSKKQFHSSSSQILFWKIYESLPDNLKSSCYFAELNQEFGCYGVDRYYFFDFVIAEIKFCIEFNGIHYHAKPTIYSETDIVTKLKGKPKLVKEIWQFDKTKNSALESRGFKILTVWEDEHQSIKEIMRNINEHSKNFKLQNSIAGS